MVAAAGLFHAHHPCDVVLAQLFFGAGAAIFLFARGVSDSAIVFALEAMV